MSFPKITYEPTNPDKLGSTVRVKIGRKSNDISQLQFKLFKSVADALEIPVEPAK